MNLKTVSDQFSSLKSTMEERVSKASKSAWTLLNYDLLENVFAPRRRVFIGLDKDSLSVVYASQFLGKSKIHVCRKYAYERKPQENVGRKYLYQDGQLPKPDNVVSTLDHFFREYGVENAKVILSIPKAWTIYRTADFPIAVLENVHDVIAYELDRLMSLASDNAYFDFKIIDQTQENLKVAVAAARKDLVDGYIRAIEDKGFAVEKVTVSLSVIGRLLRHLYGRHCFVLLDVYRDEYDVSGIDEGAVLFSHRERFSGESTDDKIALMCEDMSSLLNGMGERADAAQIVVLSDEDALEPIKDKMSRPVHMMRKSSLNIDLQAEIRETDCLSASGCLELMPGNTESLNLLSKNRKTLSGHAFRFTVMLLIAAVVFGVLSLFAPLALDKVRIHEIENQMDAMKEEFRKNEPQKNELDTVLYQIRATNEFKNSKPPRILLLRELSDILPSRFWVSRMEMTESTVEIELRGMGAQADVVKLLEASPYFKNVQRVGQDPQSGSNDMNSEMNVFKMEIVNERADRESK